MNILFLSHMFPNKVNPVNGTFVLDLARFLNKKENVTVISPVPYFPLMGMLRKLKAFSQIPQKTELEGVKVYYPRFFKIPRFLRVLDGIFYTIGCWRTAMHCIKQTDIIVVHWTFPDAFAGFIWGRLKKKKVVLIVHGNESIFYYDKPSLRKWFVGQIVKHVDYIIPVSKDLKRKIIGKYGVDYDRITVIPNGVDYNKFPITNCQEARKKLGLSENGTIILTVARLSPEKALHNLVKAFGQIEKQYDIKLIIIGDGPEKLKLQRIINEKNLSNNAFLMGAIPHEDIYLWMSAANLFLLPSLREGTPVVIGEAFACGTPVIASNVGGIPDLISDNKIGLLIEPGLVSSIVDSLDIALQTNWDKEYIKDYGSRFSWHEISKQLLTIISKLITENNRVA